MGNSSKDSNPQVANPKPEGQKHSENTSEMSDPHTSEDHPEEHVDSIAFGEGGRHEKEHDTHGITDPGAIEMGKETHELHQKGKEEKE